MVPEIHLCVHWNGNELVGPGGIEDQLAWPYKGGDGHFPSLLGVPKAQLQQLEDFKRTNRVASITVVSPPRGETYGFTPAWDEFFTRLVGWVDENLDLQPYDCATLVGGLEFIDVYHCTRTDANVHRIMASVFGSTVQSPCLKRWRYSERYNVHL